jgi:pectinesterase
VVPRLALGLLLGLAAGALRAAPSPITVFLAGDSTMAEKLDEKRPETGWGERLQALFDPAEVRVENHARNGRSTRTFLEEGRWDALIERVRPGDHVLIQFGHNDQSEDKPDRYTPPEAFQANLARFVEEVRDRGGVPVLMTPIVRRRFDAEGAFYDVHGDYPDLVRAVAADLDAPLLDLHRASWALLEASGAETSRALFLWLEPGEHPNYPEGVRDNTHFSPAGAEALARLVARALRESGLPLAAHLRQQPHAVVDGAHAEAPGALVSGTPTYRTLTEALAAAPEGDRPYVVALRDGRYYEKVTIERPGVHLIGESREGTVLTYDAVAGAPAPGGGTYGTRGSATLTVRAPDFRAERLTIENGFDYPANRAFPTDDPARVRDEQAVALLTEGASDRTVLRDCVISGHQDTLFLDAGRHHVSDCTILGHVDFVFGAGRAVFDR